MKKSQKPSETEILKDQLTRALADYDNLRKRTEEEKRLWISFSSQKILSKLLPILDALQESLKHTKDQGLALALSDFKNILKEEGLEEINPKKGDDFNHDLMEAIDTSETEDKNMNNKIESLLMSGWKFNEGPVVRHAKVKVFKLKN